MDRADVNDPPKAAPPHARQRRLGEQEWALEHHAQQLIPAVGRVRFERLDMLQAGIVDEHIDARLAQRVNQAAYLLA